MTNGLSPCLSCCLLLFHLCWIAGSLFAQEKLELEGYVRAGIEYFHNERFSESFYRGKIQYQIEINKDLQAQLDVRGESSSHTIELREAYLTADLADGRNLDFGQSKKRLGIEYQKSKENLLTIERTLIYRHLEPFGFAGRDLNFRYYRKANEEKRRNGYSASVGYNEAHDVTFVGHWSRLRTLGSFALGGSGLLQLDQMDGGRQTAWSLGFELLRDRDQHHVELEAVVGQDPFASEFRKIVLKDNDNVHFVGGKLLYGHRFSLSQKTEKAVEPVLVASILARDTEVLEWNTVQLLAGLNYYFAKRARVSVNGDFLLSNSRVNTNERTFAGSNGIVQLELRW